MKMKKTKFHSIFSLPRMKNDKNKTRTKLICNIESKKIEHNRDKQLHEMAVYLFNFYRDK